MGDWGDRKTRVGSAIHGCGTRRARAMSCDERGSRAGWAAEVEPVRDERESRAMTQGWNGMPPYSGTLCDDVLKNYLGHGKLCETADKLYLESEDPFGGYRPLRFLLNDRPFFFSTGLSSSLALRLRQPLLNVGS